MSMMEHARAELAAINYGEEDSAVMLDILEKFKNHWDSGGAHWAVVPVLVKLLTQQPLSPLTGDDEEWYDPFGGGVMLQNTRCNTVFKTWHDENGMLSNYIGQGKLKISDIENPGWDGKFPYQPPTRMPADPVIAL